MKEYSMEDFGKFSIEDELDALSKEPRKEEEGRVPDSPKGRRYSSGRKARNRDADARAQKRRLGFYLDMSLYRRLSLQADIDGVTVTALVSDILDRELRTMKQLKEDL